MLVLSRRAGEEIRIGNDIIIKVIDLSRERTSIGIEAPRDIIVHRGEIYEKIQKEKQPLT